MMTMGSESDNWTEKYRPQTLDNVVGNPTAVEELRSWALSWEEDTPKYRAVIIHGTPGTGKTTSAHALVNEMGWEVTELNASDQRTAKMIEKVVGSGSKMGTISGAKKLIILDEADNIHGNEDRGGEKAIIGLIRKTSQPIILTVNNIYDMSYALRNAGKLIQFRSITANTMASVLREIANKESITCEIGVIAKIVENADGDLRSAINDLQALSIGRSNIELNDIVTGKRDTKESIFKVLEKIFKGTDAIDAYRATFNTDEDPEGLIQWIDENLPSQYTRPQDLTEAYEHLSRASVFLGRVRIRQNYNMWRYASVLMTAGIVVARSQKPMGFIKYRNPLIRKMMKETKDMRTIRDSIAQKMGIHCHTSIRFARYNLFPFFKLMMRDKERTSQIATSLGLSPEEVTFFVESTDSKGIYDEAQSIIDKEKSSEIEKSSGYGESKVEYKKEQEMRTKSKAQSSLFDF